MNRKLYLHLAVIIFAFANLTCFAAETLDCIRAKPEPIVKTTNVVKNYSFLSTSKQEASESFTLLSGPAVNIVHSGCEKFSLKFRFKLSDEGHPVGNVNFWLQKANGLLAELESSGAPRCIPKVKMGITQALKAGSYKYNEPIEIIEEYEYTYFEVVENSPNQFEIVIIYLVAL